MLAAERRDHRQNQSEALEEVVELVRTQQRMLSHQSHTMSDAMERLAIQVSDTMMSTVKQLYAIGFTEQAQVSVELGRRMPDLLRYLRQLEKYVERAPIDGKAILVELSKLTGPLHEFSDLIERWIQHPRRDLSLEPMHRWLNEPIKLKKAGHGDASDCLSAFLLHSYDLAFPRSAPVVLIDPLADFLGRASADL